MKWKYIGYSDIICDVYLSFENVSFKYFIWNKITNQA